MVPLHVHTKWTHLFFFGSLSCTGQVYKDKFVLMLAVGSVPFTEPCLPTGACRSFRSRPGLWRAASNEPTLGTCVALAAEKKRWDSRWLEDDSFPLLNMRWWQIWFLEGDYTTHAVEKWKTWDFFCPAELVDHRLDVPGEFANGAA